MLEEKIDELTKAMNENTVSNKLLYETIKTALEGLQNGSLTVKPTAAKTGKKASSKKTVSEKPGTEADNVEPLKKKETKKGPPEIDIDNTREALISVNKVFGSKTLFEILDTHGHKAQNMTQLDEKYYGAVHAVAMAVVSEFEALETECKKVEDLSEEDQETILAKCNDIITGVIELDQAA